MRWTYLISGILFCLSADNLAKQEPGIPLDGRGGGLIVYYSENREEHQDAEIYIMNADGTAQTNLTRNSAQDLSPDLSPDGSSVVFISDRSGEPQIYRMMIDGSKITRLTDGHVRVAYPYWSPDGGKIIYCAFADGNWDVFMMNADGSGQIRITCTPENEEWAHLSPDAKRIAYAAGNFPDYDVYVMNTGGDCPVSLVKLPDIQAFPKWSRDGTTVAYNHGIFSNGTFTGDICLVNADGTHSRKITDSEGLCVNENPYWSPDGERIVFQSNRTGNFQIYIMNADGSGQVRITHHPGNDYWPAWAVCSSEKTARVPDE